MTLLELIRTADVETVLRDLAEAYPKQAPSLPGYRNVISELMGMSSSPADGSTITVVRYPAGEFTDKPCWYVGGEDADGSEWSLSFVPWADLLEREVRVKNCDLTPAQMLAHVLWEITFYGFNSEDVEIGRDDLKARMDKLDEMLAGLPENPTDAEYEAVGLSRFESLFEDDDDEEDDE